MTKLAIVGSRDYPEDKYDRIKEIILSNIDMCNITEIISGGARGIDKMAEKLASESNIKLTVFEANWKEHGRKAGPIRNQLIVDNSDILIAFPVGDSIGTRDTIKKAYKKDIRVLVIEQ